MTTPSHARPGLSLPERAARLELALAQADRAEDRRRAIEEAIEAAVEQALRGGRQLSDAYLRLRAKLQAWDTPHAPSPEQVWAHTEAKLDALMAERDRLLADLEVVRQWGHRLRSQMSSLADQAFRMAEGPAQLDLAMFDQAHVFAPKALAEDDAP